MREPLLLFHMLGLGLLVGASVLRLRALRADADPSDRAALSQLALWSVKRMSMVGLLLSVVSGLGLLRSSGDAIRQGWMHAKLGLVLVVVIVVHVVMFGIKRLEPEDDARRARLRTFAWVEWVILVVIIALVSLRPF